jgi:hypothetical protein
MMSYGSGQKACYTLGDIPTWMNEDFHEQISEPS